MRPICDMHNHSRFSDGMSTPEELILHAEKLSISAIALTDHNTIAGLPRFLQAAESSTVTAVPGIEISTDYEETELHILALFLPKDQYDRAEAFLARRNAEKEESNLRLTALLHESGYLVDYERIKQKTSAPVPNRAHFASELMDKGYCTSVYEGLSEILGKDGPFYQSIPNPQALECIREIRRWGAVPVLAHPLLSMSTQLLEQFLPVAKDAGMMGMEAIYTTFSPEQTEYIQSLCRKFDLCVSGGSDYHAGRKPGIEMGSGQGNLWIPDSVYRELKKCSRMSKTTILSEVC